MNHNFFEHKKIIFYAFIAVILLFDISSCTPTTTPAVLTKTITTTQTTFPLDTSTPAPVSTISILPTLKSTESPTPVQTPTPSSQLSPLIPDIFLSLRPGQYIFYKRPSNALFDEFSLGLARVDGSGQTEQRLPTPWTYANIALSPDQKEIFLTGSFLEKDLDKETGTAFIFNFEKQTSKQVLGKTDCGNGSWSPDGNRLAISCGGAIFIYSISDGNIIYIPVCLGACTNVNWSPNNLWLSFSMDMKNQKRPQESGVYVISTSCLNHPGTCDQTRRGPLSPYSELYNDSTGWSPDGKTFVMYSRKPHLTSKALEFEFIEVQTGQVLRTIEVPNTKDDEFQSVVWSPDGKWVAFNQADGIYKVPIEGGAPILVAHLSYPYISQWITIPHPFAPGAQYTLTPAGNGLNLRDQPSQAGKPLKVLKAGDEITIVKGPTLADGYTWWQMRTQDGVEGWAEDLPDWYAPVQAK